MKLFDMTKRNGFSDWLNKFLDEAYNSNIAFDLLATSADGFQLTLTPKSQMTVDFDVVTQEIMENIYKNQNEFGFEIVGSSSSTSHAKALKSNSRILISILGLLLPIIFCIFIIILIRRYKPRMFNDIFSRLPSIPILKLPDIKIRYFSDNFKRSRLEEPIDDISSVFPSGIEAIELPDATNEIMFDNPIYAPEIGDSKQ